MLLIAFHPHMYNGTLSETSFAALLDFRAMRRILSEANGSFLLESALECQFVEIASLGTVSVPFGETEMFYLIRRSRITGLIQVRQARDWVSVNWMM